MINQKPPVSNPSLPFLVTTLAILFVIGLSLPSTAAEDILPSIDSSRTDLHIRTLAASCAACHGTNGNTVVNNNAPVRNAILAGMDTHYFITQMLAFKNGNRQATVMHRHAKGLQMDEINLLATYFATQKRVPAISPPSQLLKANHE